MARTGSGRRKFAPHRVDPGEVGITGVDAVLRDFAEMPFGPWLLILVALGLMAFGALSFLEAKHRRTYGGVPV